MWFVDMLFLLVTKDSSCKHKCLPRVHSQDILRLFMRRQVLFSGGWEPWCLSWIGSVFDCRGSGGVGIWNCKCFAMFFCLLLLRVVIVVVCVSMEWEEAPSFVCLRVVGAGWFVGVYCVHCCFLIRFINAVF